MSTQTEQTPKKRTTKATKPVKVETTPVVVESTPVVKPKAVRTKKVSDVVVEDVSDSTPKAVRKPRAKKVAEPVLEVVAESSVEDVLRELVESDESVTEDSSSPKKKVKKLSRDELEAEFNSFFNSFQAAVDGMKDKTPEEKRSSVKNWKLLLKSLKDLKTKSLRSMKKTKKPTSESAEGSATKNESGFMKPVKISSEMASFTGFNPDDVRSRVDCTSFICDYIKKNNLQNPTHKKEILADEKLATLLDFDRNGSEPLTYCTIQKKIQRHFEKKVKA
jgi:chromatin remodeling complex protein RSC6